jgi:hypothetical protein
MQLFTIMHDHDDAGLYNPEKFSFTMDDSRPEQTLLVKTVDTLKKKQQLRKKCKTGAIIHKIMIVTVMHYNRDCL